MTPAILQNKLQYQFKNPKLLELALTHKSFAKTNNERLEFLGDAILGYVVADILFAREESFGEDEMSLARAHLVRGTTLADLAKELGLGAYLYIGSGELKSGGRERGSILADAMEALVGAIHQDSGIEACRAVVTNLFSSRLAHLDPVQMKDAKTRLQEHLQGLQQPLPRYEVVDVLGADHAREYVVSCTVGDGPKTQARGSSRRKAEKEAAILMLQKLGAADG